MEGFTHSTVVFQLLLSGDDHGVDYGDELDSCTPRPPSYLKSQFLGYVTIRYIEPSSYYLGSWEP